MVQFNLLPDVKQEFIKARRLKRMVTLIAIGASAVSLFVFVLMLVTVDFVQKTSISNLNDDIKKYSNQLKNVPDLDKILTVQNQLNTLTDLHDKKVVSSRLFTYISQLTPTTSSLTKINVDYTANTMTIQGTAPSLDSANVFTDALKATTYATDDDKSGKTKAFSQVVLSQFARDSKQASYTITLSFDPLIFDSAHAVTLTVPEGSGGADLFGNTENQ